MHGLYPKLLCRLPTVDSPKSKLQLDNPAEQSLCKIFSGTTVACLLRRSLSQKCSPRKVCWKNFISTENSDHLIGSNFIRRRSPGVIFVYKIKLKSHQKVFSILSSQSSPLLFEFQLSAKSLSIQIALYPTTLCSSPPLYLARFAFRLSSITKSSGFVRRIQFATFSSRNSVRRIQFDTSSSSHRTDSNCVNQLISLSIRPLIYPTPSADSKRMTHHVADQFRTLTPNSFERALGFLN